MEGIYDSGTNTELDINQSLINQYLAMRYPVLIDNTLVHESIIPIDTSRIVNPLLPDVDFWFMLISTLEYLNDLYEECSSANWDGYDADPISKQTLFEAEKFLKMLPQHLPIPEMQPEPDGEIGFEWYKGSGHSFVMSVGGNNVITYAGRFGEASETYGTEVFKDSIPKIILYNLKRLYPNIND